MRLDDSANPCTCQGWQRQRSAALVSRSARPCGPRQAIGQPASSDSWGGNFHCGFPWRGREGRAWLACERRWPPDPPMPLCLQVATLFWFSLSQFSSFASFVSRTLAFSLSHKIRERCCGFPGCHLNFLPARFCSFCPQS
ncbi:hypothetical protein BJX68DRAFT_194938 [Aspergillus pseudodeflectus]|uniref:Uncharacterized protein n=1 Tax=Aspergillus pseudodeflectus TaxID=176178 RepID=A0ABR4KXK4_9EURO